ncbi:MAG: hypothetical protein IPM54_21535 [Polyangiaceae bacterium]|nr:hypothetical protein [Polyangiaceae bacterium]
MTIGLSKLLRFLWCLSFALSMLGCAHRWTVHELRERNPRAFFATICTPLTANRLDAEFWAVGTNTDRAITDRDFDFGWYASDAKGFYHFDRSENSECNVPAEPPDLPDELRAEWVAELEQSCAVATRRPDPRYAAQVAPPDVAGYMASRAIIRTLTFVARHGTTPPTAEDQPPIKEHPVVQFGGGFAGGASVGAVPGGAIASDIAIHTGVISRGTYWARVGKACGEIAVGTGQIILGCAGTTLGAGMSSTGGGAPPGVLVMAGSLELAGAGCVTAGHGIGQLFVEVWRGNDDPAPSSSGTPQATSQPAPSPPPAPAAKPPQAPAAKPPQAPAAKPPQAPKAASGQTTTTTRVKPSQRPGGKQTGKWTKTWVKCTGDWHHAISKEIHKVLQQHTTLKNVYKARDDRFVTQAVDKSAHRGYETWHRQMEEKVIDWLRRFDKATPAEFEAYLRDLYKTDKTLDWRFPNGL